MMEEFILGRDNYSQNETHHDHEHWKELQLAKTQTEAINKALQQEVQVKSTDTVNMVKEGNWQDDDLDETLSAEVRLAGGENAISSTGDGLYAQDHTKTIVRIDGDITDVKDNIGGINNRIDNLVKQQASGANVTEVTDARRDYAGINWNTLQANIINNQSGFFEAFDRQLKSAGYYQRYEDIDREMNGFQYNRDTHEITLSSEYRSSKTLSVEKGDIVYFKVTADEYIPPYAFIDTADQVIGFRPPTGEHGKVEEYTVLIPYGVNRLKISTTTDGTLEIYVFDPTPTWEAKDPIYKLIRGMEVNNTPAGYYADVYDTETGTHIKLEHTDTKNDIKDVYFSSKMFDPNIEYVNVTWDSWITNPYGAPYKVDIYAQASTASGAVKETLLASYTHITGDIVQGSDIPNVVETHVTGETTVAFYSNLASEELVANTGRIVICIRSLGSPVRNTNFVHAECVIETDIVVTPVDELMRSVNYDNNLRKFLLGIQERIDDLQIGDSTSDTSHRFNTRLETVESTTSKHTAEIATLKATSATKEELNTKASSTYVNREIEHVKELIGGDYTTSASIDTSALVGSVASLIGEYNRDDVMLVGNGEDASGGWVYDDTNNLPRYQAEYLRHFLIHGVKNQNSSIITTPEEGDIILLKNWKYDDYVVPVIFLNKQVYTATIPSTDNILGFVRPLGSSEQGKDFYIVVPTGTKSILISGYPAGDDELLKPYISIYRTSDFVSGYEAKNIAENGIDYLKKNKADSDDLTKATKRITTLEEENADLKKTIERILSAYPLPVTYNTITNPAVSNVYYKKVDGTSGKTLQKNVTLLRREGDEEKNIWYLKKSDDTYKQFSVDDKTYVVTSGLFTSTDSALEQEQDLYARLQDLGVECDNGLYEANNGTYNQWSINKEYAEGMLKAIAKQGYTTIIIDAGSGRLTYSELQADGFDWNTYLTEVKERYTNALANLKAEYPDVTVIVVSGWAGLKAKNMSDNNGYNFNEELFTLFYSDENVDFLIDLREWCMTYVRGNAGNFNNIVTIGNTEYRYPNTAGFNNLAEQLNTIMVLVKKLRATGN